MTRKYMWIEIAVLIGLLVLIPNVVSATLLYDNEQVASISYAGDYGGGYSWDGYAIFVTWDSPKTVKLLDLSGSETTYTKIRPAGSDVILQATIGRDGCLYFLTDTALYREKPAYKGSTNVWFTNNTGSFDLIASGATYFGVANAMSIAAGENGIYLMGTHKVWNFDYTTLSLTGVYDLPQVANDCGGCAELTDGSGGFVVWYQEGWDAYMYVYDGSSWHPLYTYHFSSSPCVQRGWVDIGCNNRVYYGERYTYTGSNRGAVKYLDINTSYGAENQTTLFSTGQCGYPSLFVDYHDPRLIYTCQAASPGYVWVYDYAIPYSKTCAQYTNSLTLDDTTYYRGENVTIDYSIQGMDLANHSYYIKINHTVGGETESYSLTVSKDTKIWSISDSEAYGTYNFTLREDTTVLAYQIADIIFEEDYGDYTLSGYVKDAEDGATISNAIVLLDTDTDDTDADGYYFFYTNFGDHTINITKTGYYGTEYDLILTYPADYKLNLSLIPTSPTFSNSSILGIVTALPYNNPLEGATVHISNGSWSDSTTSSTTGYYIFDGLENGTYTLYAAQSGYDTTSSENVTVAAASFEVHNIAMNPNLVLTVKAKSLLGSNTIYNFTASVNGSEKSTSTGSVNYTDIDYGYYEITVSSGGYLPNQKTIYLDKDTETIVFLEKETEGGTGVYYPPPHLVEFRVQTWQGIPYSGVNVTAKGYSTTMGTWDWLYNIFGYKNETQIHNVTMSDTTDSNGAISFLMVPTIKYEMTFTKGTEINETLYIAPGVRFYKIIIGTKWVETLSQWDVVNYSILAGELNDTHAYINFSYVDANNKTTSLDYFINLINWTSSSNIYNHSYDISNSSNITNSYIVLRGEAYLIGFEADNLDYNEIKYLITIRIFEKDKRLLELEGVPDYIYTYISIGALMLVAAFFGMVTVPEGGIVVCLEAWVLWFVGFFLWQNPLAPLYLTVATVFAILIIFTAKGRQKGVS